MPMSAHLNVIPFHSYDMLLGMDWLFIHKTKVDLYEKAIECLDDDGERIILKGNKNPALVRMVTTMEEKNRHKKGCLLFLVHISNGKGKDVEDDEVLKKYLVLHQFQDVFPVEIALLPPHRELYLSIDLMLGETPIEKSPYRMITLELVELKLQMKEMLMIICKVGYVTLGCTNIICNEEGWYSQIVQ